MFVAGLLLVLPPLVRAVQRIQPRVPKPVFVRVTSPPRDPVFLLSHHLSGHGCAALAHTAALVVLAVVIPQSQQHPVPTFVVSELALVAAAVVVVVTHRRATSSAAAAARRSPLPTSMGSDGGAHTATAAKPSPPPVYSPSRRPVRQPRVTWLWAYVAVVAVAVAVALCNFIAYLATDGGLPALAGVTSGLAKAVYVLVVALFPTLTALYYWRERAHIRAAIAAARPAKRLRHGQRPGGFTLGRNWLPTAPGTGETSDGVDDDDEFDDGVGTGLDDDGGGGGGCGGGGSGAGAGGRPVTSTGFTNGGRRRRGPGVDAPDSGDAVNDGHEVGDEGDVRKQDASGGRAVPGRPPTRVSNSGFTNSGMHRRAGAPSAVSGSDGGGGGGGGDSGASAGRGPRQQPRANTGFTLGSRLQDGKARARGSPSPSGDDGGVVSPSGDAAVSGGSDGGVAAVDADGAVVGMVTPRAGARRAGSAATGGFTLGSLIKDGQTSQRRREQRRSSDGGGSDDGGDDGASVASAETGDGDSGKRSPRSPRVASTGFTLGALLSGGTVSSTATAASGAGGGGEGGEGTSATTAADVGGVAAVAAVAGMTTPRQGRAVKSGGFTLGSMIKDGMSASAARLRRSSDSSAGDGDGDGDGASPPPVPPASTLTEGDRDSVTPVRRKQTHVANTGFTMGALLKRKAAVSAGPAGAGDGAGASAPHSSGARPSTPPTVSLDDGTSPPSGDDKSKKKGRLISNTGFTLGAILRLVKGGGGGGRNDSNAVTRIAGRSPGAASAVVDVDARHDRGAAAVHDGDHNLRSTLPFEVGDDDRHVLREYARDGTTSFHRVRPQARGVAVDGGAGVASAVAVTGGRVPGSAVDVCGDLDVLPGTATLGDDAVAAQR